MPIDPIRLLRIFQELDAVALNNLEEIDREVLLATKATLKALKRDVDRALLRLSFLEVQSLN